MNVDVPDGVRCTVYFLPSHDVYLGRGDAADRFGGTSTFNAGCGGAPGGTTLAVQPLPFFRQRAGNPSTRWAMMLRWISEVPPAMVPEKLRA